MGDFVLLQQLITVPSIECAGIAKDSIRTAFSLNSGPINTGSENFGYGNCQENGFGDIMQNYPQGDAGSSGGSGFYWQLLDGGHGERESLLWNFNF